MLGGVEVRARRLRARGEQLDGVVGRERVDGIEMLGGDPQRNPARDDEPQLRASARQLRNVGRRVDDLLEVVEHEQHLTIADERDDAVREGALLRLLHVEGRRERGRKPARSVTSAKPTKAAPSGKSRAASVRATLGRQTRLSHSARPRHRHDTVSRARVRRDRRARDPGRGARCSARAAASRSRRSPRPFPRALTARERRGQRPRPRRGRTARPTFLNWNEPSGAISRSSWFLTWSYAVSERKTEPGTANDSTRAATLTASPVSRSGSTRTSPTWIPIRTGMPALAEIALHRDRGLHRCECAREHREAAVAEPLDDRSAGRVVIAVERAHVTVALLHGGLLVGLHERRVADHVGEHHRHESPLGLRRHRQNLQRLAGSCFL